MFAASPAYQVVTTIISYTKSKPSTQYTRTRSQAAQGILSLMQADDQLLEERPI